jgi:hypothetical protein
LPLLPADRPGHLHPKVDGTNITDTGKRFKLPGDPASVRMSTH